MKDYIKNIIDILSVFLGKPKNDYIDLNSNLNFEFNCPRCTEENCYIPDNKYNLSITLSKGGGLFNCWKCSTHYDDMKGKIYRLFKQYGNYELWEDYKHYMRLIRESDLYKLNFSKDDFTVTDEENNELYLPDNFVRLTESNKSCKAMSYLLERGIDEKIVYKYRMGYTKWNDSNKSIGNRIVIPSYSVYHDLNYWVARDFSGKQYMKYMNPKVEKKDIIFGENLINWDNDITLCEGVFDSIVIPNSIPLLGKSINKDFKVYKDLFEKANGYINIFLDGDNVGVKAGYKLYNMLNHGKLYNRIRFVQSINELDPSEIYKIYGKKGIIYAIGNAYQIKPYLLDF